MRRDYLFITGLALLFFFPFLGSIHLFDGDEIKYAECAREMLLTGEWMRAQIDFQPVFDTPPLFLWAQALSMQVFGVNEFAARFPNAVCGLVTLLMVYRIGLRLHDRMFAWLWVLAWLGSFLPHVYFRSGMIDPWFNLLVFCGLYGFIEFRWQFLTRKSHTAFWQRYRYLLAGGGLLGLAILVHGSVAYVVVIVVLGLYWARYRFKGRGYLGHLILFSSVAWLVPSVWLVAETALYDADFAQNMIALQLNPVSIAGDKTAGLIIYPVLMLLAGGFPVSVFALPNLWGDRQPEDELLESDTLAACQRSDLTTWMQLLFWSAFVVCCLAQMQTSSLASLSWFPMTYLGAVTIWRAIRWGVRPAITTIMLPLTGILLGSAVAIIPWLGMHPEFLRRLFSNDPFALEALEAETGWELWQGIPGILLFAASIAAWYFWRKNRPWLAAQTVFVAGAIFSKLTMIFIFCNIEGHTQRAAVEFYKSKRNEPCVITPLSFKTYAHLFYSCKQPGAVDGKTYLVTKTGSSETIPDPSYHKELNRKNGFVFWEKLTLPEVER